ncbi:sulfite exporter TauE/SafE family protein [Candidatus Micrarchaeota archaeon]|nr:sulfite exporter TauE/SafE family protein [Candidatus Micrarchaeota archaeon]
MKYTAKVEGMHCTSCEKIIEDALKEVNGVESVKVNYTDGSLEIEHDPHTSIKKFENVLNSKEYSLKEEERKKNVDSGDDGIAINFKLPPVALALGSVAVLLGAFFLLGGLDIAQLPQIDSNAGLVALFLLGVVTSLHCVAMCGGFIVSYSSHCAAKGEKGFAPHALYAGGKLASYTIIGALLGLLGSFIAITLEMRAFAAILAGAFLLLFGLNTLNVHPALKKLMPRLPNFGESIARGKNNSPLLVGLANGLFIACGPLQAMYVLAAGTGNPLSGGLALFAFGLGTLPMLLGFGAIASRLTAQMHASISKVSGVLVVFLALLMLNNGFALLGSGFSASSFTSVLSSSSRFQNAEFQSAEFASFIPPTNAQGFQEVVMEVNGYGYTPGTLVVKKGVPVKWVINVTRLTGCNNEIIMREYGIDVKLKNGVQTVEFTPTREGTVQFSCWMGMLRGSFVVVSADASSAGVNKTIASAQNVKASQSGSCGLGGGGCGCGAR